MTLKRYKTGNMTDFYTHKLWNPTQHLNSNKHLSSNILNKRQKTLFMATMKKVSNNLSLNSPQELDKVSPLPLTNNLNNPSSLLLDKLKLIPHSPQSSSQELRRKEALFQRRNNSPWWSNLDSFRGSIPHLSQAVPAFRVEGRLHHFGKRREEWDLDPWAVSVIKNGHNIDFLRRCPLSNTPLIWSGSTYPTRNQLLQTQFQTLLETVVVSKLNNQWRPEIDLTSLNVKFL